MKKNENQLIENLKTFLAIPYAYFAALSVSGALILIFEVLMDTPFYNMFEGIREIVMFLFGMLYIAGIINAVFLAVAVIWCIVICCKEKSKEIFFKPYVAIVMIFMIIFLGCWRPY